MSTLENQFAQAHSTRREFAGNLLGVAGAAALKQPRAAAEDLVYEYTPADNGAGPLWDYGAPGIVRYRETVYTPGLDTIPEVKPLHNCRWALYRRDAGKWQRLLADEKGRQREPCPLGIFENGRLVLSVNPTLTAPGAYSGPADPQLLMFPVRDFNAPPTVLRPAWSGKPRLSEHTYRGMGVDGRKGELLMLHNDGSGAPKAFWAYFDRGGEWRNAGVIEYPIRGCYPQVGLHNGAAHVLAVGDVVEPVAEWKKWKFEASGGRQWDYVFRRLFYVSNPQVGRRPFGDIVEVANVDKTAGHITNLDLWLAPNGDVHLLYLVRNVTSRAMRDRFFPGVPLTSSLEHATVRAGQVAARRTVFAGEEDAGAELPVWARFHSTPKGKLYVLASTRSQAEGKPVWGMRLFAAGAGAVSGVRVDLRHPFANFMTATERGGSRPSNFIDVIGAPAGERNSIRYACIEV
jgi:hypothetical protein